MSSKLSGARLKLARAEEHFGELSADHQRFLERNPYRALRETDERNHHFLWRIKIIEQPPLWAALIGDCVHALRSALDHTACALVQIKQPTSTKGEFPIFEYRSTWDAGHAKDLPGVEPEVLAIAESLQPYNRGKTDDPLWQIHMLDIIDKHRGLHVVTSMLEGSRWAIEGAAVDVTDPALGPFKDGAVVGRFKITSEEGANVRMQTEFTFGIAFGEGMPAEGKSVIPTLEWLRVYTGGVISQFERFL